MHNGMGLAQPTSPPLNLWEVEASPREPNRTGPHQTKMVGVGPQFYFETWQHIGRAFVQASEVPFQPIGRFLVRVENQREIGLHLAEAKRPKRLRETHRNRSLGLDARSHDEPVEALVIARG